MKSLKIILLILILITFVLSFQNNVYGMTTGGIKIASTVDDIMKDADDFLRQGNEQIDEAKLKDVSDFLYNLLLGVGIVVAVGVGMVIGIKYMVSGLDEKAEMKKALVGYVISCAVIFGAFGIWKLAVTVFSSF